MEIRLVKEQGKVNAEPCNLNKTIHIQTVISSALFFVNYIKQFVFCKKLMILQYKVSNMCKHSSPIFHFLEEKITFSYENREYVLIFKLLLNIHKAVFLLAP